MMIFYKPGYFGTVDPIVVLDYTRSDDQYSPAQIAMYVNSLGVLAAKGKAINPLLPINIFSLDYQMSFTHSANTYGQSLKTNFKASISNAPMELIGLLNIKSYVSEENILAIQSGLSQVIDPQVFFPTGAFVIKPNSNTAATLATTITRTFMLYSTPFNFDPLRLNSTLELNGAAFDDMVVRLLFKADIKKELPLSSQIKTAIATAGYLLVADESALANDIPKIARYYPPAPMSSVVGEICRDNGLFFDIDSDRQTVTIQGTAFPPKPNSPVTPQLTFGNYVPGSYLMSSFVLENYATCRTEAEAFDVSLFSTIIVWDDSFNRGQFDHLRKIPATFPVGSSTLFGYSFYVLEYAYQDSRNRTSVTIKATNNWIVSNFKLDAFLENKVYGSL